MGGGCGGGAAPGLRLRRLRRPSIVPTTGGSTHSRASELEPRPNKPTRPAHSLACPPTKGTHLVRLAEIGSTRLETFADRGLWTRARQHLKCLEQSPMIQCHWNLRSVSHGKRPGLQLHCTHRSPNKIDFLCATFLWKIWIKMANNTCSHISELSLKIKYLLRILGLLLKDRLWVRLYFSVFQPSVVSYLKCLAGCRHLLTFESAHDKWSLE